MTDHAERLHSPWGASSASRYFACPGSVNRCRGVVDIPSEAALEGTQAHELLEYELRTYFDLGGNPTVLAGMWNAVPEFRRENMKEAVNVAIDYVLALMLDYEDAQLILEQRFEIPSEVAPGEVFGTCDILVYIPSICELHVIDYKHGAGVLVDVKNNKQTRIYAIGATTARDDWNVGRIVMTIIQPRAFHADGPIRSDVIEPGDLFEFHAELEEAIAATLNPDAPLIPGKEQCLFCAAAPGCPARERLALSVVNQDFGHVKQITKETLPVVAQMTPDRIAYVLDAKALVMGWFEDVEEHAKAVMRQGVRIPGRKLVEAQARRRWDGDDELLAHDLHLLVDGKIPAEDFLVTRLKTITDVEAVVKKHYRDQAPRGQKKDAAEKAGIDMAFLTVKESSGNLVLAPDTDKRPAVNLASDSFGHIQLPKIDTAS